MATITATERTSPDFFTEDEIAVAQMLLSLRNTLTPPGPRWVRKKKRSGPRETSLPPHNRSSDGEIHCKSKPPSPATPLSFSPSDTDTVDAIPTPTPVKKRGPKKKTNKELKELVSELFIEQEKIKSKEAEIRKFHERLLSLNLQLRSYESQLDQCNNSEQLEIRCRNSDLVGATQSSTPLEQSLVSRLSINQSHIAEFGQNSYQLPFAVDSRTHSSSRVVPDLNVSGEAPVDLSFVNFDFGKAAIAAQARKRRLEHNRVKRVRRPQNHV